MAVGHHAGIFGEGPDVQAQAKRDGVSQRTITPGLAVAAGASGLAGWSGSAMSIRARVALWFAAAGVPLLVLYLFNEVSAGGLVATLLALGMLWLAIGLELARPLEAVDRLTRRLAAPDDAVAATGMLADRVAALVEAASAYRRALDASEHRHAVAMREIHHRIKNNLQIVSSLLDLQVNRVRSPEAHAALSATRARVATLGLVHRHLYNDAEFHTVELDRFMHELCDQLKGHVTGAILERVKVEVEAPKLRIAPEQAVAIGMITTEAVNNALQHAFPDGREGSIRVACEVGGTEGLLKVVDDGVGWNAEQTPEHSLGTLLIGGFAKRLAGQLAVDGRHGTEVVVRFSLAA
jgi:two-component sensor histidine kinase